MKRFLLICFVTGLASGLHRPSVAQDVDDNAYLRWTEQVGRLLHGYMQAKDAAVSEIHRFDAGSDAMPPLFAGAPFDGGWAFSFGSLESDSAFVIRYGVIVSADLEIEQFDHFENRRLASPHHTVAAVALARIITDVEARRESGELVADEYRFAVLPFPERRLTAFVVPRQTLSDVTLAGNDAMYSISRADGSIINRTPFHRRLLQIPLERPEGGMGALIVPSAPLPSPVDVLHALERGSPLVVLADLGVFVIDPDGAISRLPDDDPQALELRSAAGLE